MRVPIAVFTCLIGLGGAAKAESINLLHNEYKPLVNTRAGRIEACGLHFASVITTLDQRPMAVQGSINTMYFEDKMPGLSIKVVVVEGRGGKLIRHKVHHASMRVGKLDTRAMKAVPGEDGKSLMLFTHMGETGEFFGTFPIAIESGAWLSFSLDL